MTARSSRPRPLKIVGTIRDQAPLTFRGDDLQPFGCVLLQDRFGFTDLPRDSPCVGDDAVVHSVTGSVCGFLDPKALARLSGDRRVELAPLKDVQPLTGYVRGAVTALGPRRDPVYADETIELYDVISVSAGVRGTQVLIAPADYLRAVSPTLGPIARDKK